MEERSGASGWLGMGLWMAVRGVFFHMNSSCSVFLRKMVNNGVPFQG